MAAQEIFIRGNLYLTDEASTSKLVKDGIIVYAKKDVIFLSEPKIVQLEDGDVYIENLMDKLPIKDIVANSTLPIN